MGLSWSYLATYHEFLSRTASNDRVSQNISPEDVLLASLSFRMCSHQCRGKKANTYVFTTYWQILVVIPRQMTKHWFLTNRGSRARHMTLRSQSSAAEDCLSWSEWHMNDCGFLNIDWSLFEEPGNVGCPIRCQICVIALLREWTVYKIDMFRKPGNRKTHPSFHVFSLVLLWANALCT